MKGKSIFSKKKCVFYSLHMKEKPPFSKNEKCFSFFKMDKKNVQIPKTQIFYGKSVDCDDKKN